MSDGVSCEKCGKVATRQRWRCSPVGWWFASFKFDPDGAHDPGDMLIVHACSLECRDALWEVQVDQRWDVIEARVDIRAELRRAARVQAAELRDRAGKMRTGCYTTTGIPAQAPAAHTFADMLDKAAAALEDAAEAQIDAMDAEAAEAVS